jgi:Rieske Fe-S protein
MMMTRQPQQNRRGILLGAGLAGIGGVLTGCSTAPVPYDSNVFGGIPHDEEVPTPTAGPGGQTTPVPVASVTDIPVGGGVIFPQDNLVITQPTAGEFRAFSIVCTHLGCLCDKVADGTIDCPCHGSRFSITDGAPVTGPATRPLESVSISVADGTVTLV